MSPSWRGGVPGEPCGADDPARRAPDHEMRIRFGIANSHTVGDDVTASCPSPGARRSRRFNFQTETKPGLSVSLSKRCALVFPSFVLGGTPIRSFKYCFLSPLLRSGAPAPSRPLRRLPSKPGTLNLSIGAQSVYENRFAQVLPPAERNSRSRICAVLPLIYFTSGLCRCARVARTCR